MKMGIEAFSVFEMYANQQKRIYPDSCDYGVIADSECFYNIKSAVQELKDMAFNIKTLSENKLKNYYYKTIEIFFAWERENNLYLGHKVVLTYHNTNKLKYFSIDITRSTGTENDWLKK